MQSQRAKTTKHPDHQRHAPSSTKSSGSPITIPVHPILRLQQTIGNHTVQRLIQTKLRIGEPNEKLEREADRVAEEVMRMPEPHSIDQKAQPDPSLEQRIQLLCPECEEELHRQTIDEEKEEETLQARKNVLHMAPEGTSDLEFRIQSLKDGGQVLPESVRAFFEPRFGADFSGVRLHTDTKANALNQTLNARAFTTGQNIFFRQGEYSPSGSGGRKLLAHELTHVVQQLSGAVLAESRVSHPDDTLEKEARSVAEVTTSGSPVIVRALQGIADRPTVQRQHGKRAVASNNLLVSRDETLTSNPTATRLPDDWYPKTINALRSGSNRAYTTANRYAIQVERAAEAFKDYAKPQVEELKGQTTGADLIGGLASVFPNVLPHFIASRVAAGFFRELATNTAKVARNTMVSAVQDAVRLGSSVKDLEAAIDLLPKRSKDLASTLPEFVHRKFDQRVGDLIKTPRGKWTAEDALVVRPFVEALMASPAGVTPEQLDIIIETQLGLPSPAHTLDFQIQLYRTWVEVFAQKRIVAESSPYWHIYQIVSPRDIFGEMARAESEAQAQARRRRLESVMPR